MDATIADTPAGHAPPARLLPGPALRALSARSDARGAAQLAFHLLLLLAGGAWVSLAGPWTLLPAMLALGVAQAALFAPLHETMHQTAFASRRANAVVGWLCGCPSLYNWHFYQVFHLAHHRHTQDPARDPELLSPVPDTTRAYLWRVLAVPYWQTRLRVIRDCWRGDLAAYPYIPARAAPKVIRSVRAMTVFDLALAGGAGLLFGWWAPVCLWIVPQLLGQPALRLYLLTEHTLCSQDANGLTNTRTMLTNALLRRLMWNMPYHTEHHLYPSIPFHRLPDAHAALRDRLAHVERGYVRWHAGFLRHLRGGA
ncbi:fatty acid desaturase [Roseomonas sp. NAR14]|uniref:Fatty acid desaturase n=1 Tax=Roseomonas acroporae TaxID=2937791 RepID=A0A9X1YEC3_9PROT|nr:fatty acid desaturase [Roseomonas acroporae]MCK8787598.1 fatty acid desaturase [Roseomonas acroporae]